MEKQFISNTFCSQIRVCSKNLMEHRVRVVTDDSIIQKTIKVILSLCCSMLYPAKFLKKVCNTLMMKIESDEMGWRIPPQLQTDSSSAFIPYQAWVGSTSTVRVLEEIEIQQFHFSCNFKKFQEFASYVFIAVLA